MAGGASTGAAIGSFGGPIGTAYGAAIGGLFGGGRKKTYLGSELQPPTEREQWRIDRIQKLMGDMAPPEDVLRAISTDQDMSDRFIQNAGEFYSHPGSYQALQQAMGMFGQQAPDVYGAPWESMMRSKMMGQYGGELAGMQDQATSGMAQRGLYGAMGGAQQTQIGQAGAQARLQGMMGLQGMLSDKRYQMFNDQFGRDMQASNLLSGLVGGQPAYPIMQDQGMTADQKIMGYMGAAGGMIGGIGGLLGGLGGGGKKE